ncbi:MAG: Bax inhibitor-1/YccA family protein [Succinivibrio sp.]|nr:Bax inhibitor-1/YccA family protein [Succinivibrio sp.]MDY5187868.1 Bax inhibitor-1/YccA family protein [Succinivibrio sp.]
MQLQSSNPAIAVARNQAGTFNFGGEALGATIQGTTTKAIVLVALTLVVGLFAMNYTMNSLLYGVMPSFLMYGSLIAGVVVAFITIFKPTTAPITAPIYAVLEGAALGSLSAIFELQYPGIVTTAVLSTFVVVMSMLALWKFKVIVPTQKFKAVLTGAITGIFVLYMINLVVSLFGVSFLPQTGPLSILISLIVCTVAALSLILDFDNIQQAVDAGLPKYFEYFNAFSLLVTICWLYVEILKLLAKRED